MCGISGYLGDLLIPQERIDKCLSLMRRRGPDHQGYKHFVNPVGKHIYLLSSRLAIIDLDPRANQPFSVGPLTMVFNGECYSYKEMRRELEEESCEFRTESDTEVFLCSILHWGWNVALSKAEGMWAFAVYDLRDGSLTLVRDRFSEKPLYLYWDKGDLYFGSEPKFIWTLLGRSLPVNYRHLYRFLVLGYKSLHKTLYDFDHQETTFFEGLQELPPAHVLRIDVDGKQTLRRYWCPEFRPDEKMPYEDAVEGVRERLIRSVELRLRADVPVAACHSGGIDSNSIVAIAKKKLGYPIHSFYVASLDPRYDEGEMVSLAVRELDIRHTSIPLHTEGFLGGLRELVCYHDAPVLTLTAYIHWLLIKAMAQQGYKVVISGIAADECFSGYTDHPLFYMAELHRQGLGQKAWEEELVWINRVKPYVRNPYLQNALLFTAQPHFRGHIYLGADFFARFLKTPFYEPFTEQRYCNDLLRNRLQNELFHESVPVVLSQDDKNSMRESIENRSPFLDRSLVDFSLTIPTRHLIRDGYTKSPLRSAMRGLVSSKILDSYRKTGWNTNIFNLLNVSNPEVKDWLFNGSPFYDYVHKEKVVELAANPYLENAESKLFFSLVSTKIFMEEFS